MEPVAANMEWIKARTGDNSDDFVRRFREPIFRLALSITGRPDMAEDVAQEALLRGLRHRHKLDDPLKWLRVVTVRQSMTALSQSKRAVPEAEPSNRPELVASLAVRQTLASLTADQQALLALAIGEGWSYAEIAGALDIPEGTVASRLHAAKEAFRKKWVN